jgi:hypothetical protein
VSWIERAGARVVLDESPLTAAALGASRRPLTPAAATAALRVLGRRLDAQVLAGATKEQLDDALAVMRSIKLQLAGSRRVAAARVAGRPRKAAGRIRAA